ncbi:MAG TPA: tRNA uridine-5-carboxymethylaminomethyl(34) synthesis GTPase MnmE, partial [Chloroflexota bacterium]
MDTIVALVTPPGEGGVGIVRVSGPLSPVLPQRLFPALSSPWKSHRLRQGQMLDPADGTPIDLAVGCLMHAPRSYTGEDVFEIHCHGSPLILERVVKLCLAEGCRAARPGEFTLRAFLNGKLDLSQAEAVVDVVRARTNAGLDIAMRQLSGWLSQTVEPLRQSLIGDLAHMEAMVDFVEDDIPPQLDASTATHLRDTATQIDSLLAGAEQGAVLREGATLAIVGSPNVGKSSIMNGLLGMDRSIVTSVAGTTRDTVEESLQVRGIPFRVVDTAGITETHDLVEKIGIDRSRQSLAAADVVLLVLDKSRPLSPQDRLTFETLIAEFPSATPPSPALEEEEHEARSVLIRQAPTRGGLAGTNGVTQTSLLPSPPPAREYRSEMPGVKGDKRLVIALNKSDLPGQISIEPELAALRPLRVVDSNTVSIGGLDALRDALE